MVLRVRERVSGMANTRKSLLSSSHWPLICSTFLLLVLYPNIQNLGRAGDFVDNFDMNGDYARYVYYTDKIRVWNQASNGYLVRSWGPCCDNEPGVLILRYTFDKPIAKASVRFNLLLHRNSSRGKVEVSYDNENYTLLTDMEQKPAESVGYETTVFDLSPVVAGKKQVFLRVTLSGQRLNTSIVGTDFLRTAKHIPKFSRPYVYEFRASTEPVDVQD